MSLKNILREPYREYALIVILFVALGYHYLFHGGLALVIVAALLGSILPLRDAWGALRRRTITIEAFNFFALFVSFATREFTSAAFIALMLSFAAWLDWKTQSRATNAVEELLKLKPTRALRERGGKEEDIDASTIQTGDILIVKNGERVPADGVVIFGTAFVNEASLTGESIPIEKNIGDEVYSSTVAESGVIKIRATKVGADSTLERMATLIEEAGKNKSKTERLADRFAGIFLPIVLVGGAVTYFVTGNIAMTAALFLIVCADDIAVSIPLAITASLGYAAKRGVIIKGGEWLRVLANVKTLLFDKTGTLTHGRFVLASVILEPGMDEKLLWELVGTAEKFSEHPVGKALYREALQRIGEAADPDEVRVLRGAGIFAKKDGHMLILGNRGVVTEEGMTVSSDVLKRFTEKERDSETAIMLFLDGKFAGFMGIADTPRKEAHAALSELRRAGIRLVMLTGDNEEVARAISKDLGIDEVRAKVTPEGKMNIIEEESKRGGLAMVGDGVNDAPALARADVGIAMGEGGTAVAVEAADVVILTDRLDRIPEMIALSRKTVSVVNLDIAIWVATNVIGIALVFTGIATPAIAALYNFLTDFLPLMNSARLFKRGETGMDLVR
ncbi:MAG: cation-translocating P-type ATPase [Candidatus Moraniibacteriota bacterium]